MLLIRISELLLHYFRVASMWVIYLFPDPQRPHCPLLLLGLDLKAMQYLMQFRNPEAG